MSNVTDPWDFIDLEGLGWFNNEGPQCSDAMCLDPTSLPVTGGETLAGDFRFNGFHSTGRCLEDVAFPSTSISHAAPELFPHVRDTDDQALLCESQGGVLARRGSEYQHEHVVVPLRNARREALTVNPSDSRSEAEQDSDFSWRTYDIEDQWYFALQNELLAFRANEYKISLLTDALLPRQRRKIHAMCHMMRLSHMSYGEQRRKRILVSKCVLGGIRFNPLVGRTWNPKSNQWLEGTLDPTIVVLDGKDLPPHIIRDCLARADVAVPCAIGSLQYRWHTSLWRTFMAFEEVDTAAACLLALRTRPDLAKDLNIYGYEFYRFGTKAQSQLIIETKTTTLSAEATNLLAGYHLSDDYFTELGVKEDQGKLPDTTSVSAQLQEAPLVRAVEHNVDAPSSWSNMEFLSVPAARARSYDTDDDTGGFDTDGTGGTGFSYMSIGRDPWELHSVQGYGSSSDPDYGSNLSVSVSKKRKRVHNVIAYEKAPDSENPFGRECTFEFCGKKFERECDARKHEKVHFGPRPFKCEKCEKAFMWNKDLIRHEKVHERAELKAQAKAAKALKKANAELRTGPSEGLQDNASSNRSRAFGKMAGKFKSLLS